MPKRWQAFVALAIVVVGLSGALLIPGVRNLLISSNNAKAFSLMNRDRVNNSPYRALAHNSQLQAYAQNWANHMAKTGVLVHDSIRNHFCCPSTLGENVGSGSTIELIEQAFMKSHEHKYNIVYPFYTEAGVAVAYNSKQRLFYIDQAFRARNRRTVKPRPLRTTSSRPAPLSTRTIQPRITPSPTPSSIVITPPPLTSTNQSSPLPHHGNTVLRVALAGLIVALGAGSLFWLIRRRKIK